MKPRLCIERVMFRDWISSVKVVKVDASDLSVSRGVEEHGASSVWRSGSVSETEGHHK